MAKTNALNPNVPLDTENPKLGAKRIRDLAAAVAELLGIDHYIGTDSGSGYTEDAAGEHSKVTIRNGTVPTTAAGKGFLYVVSGELYYKDASGNITQLTLAGKLNRLALSTLLYDTYFQAIDKAGTGSVNLIKSGRNEADNADVAILSDKVRTATNAAPTEDTQISNKKYVDNKVSADIAAAVAVNCLIADSTIFTTTNISQVWTNPTTIDFSSVVGANRALLIVLTTCHESGNRNLQWNPSGDGGGDGDDYWDYYISYHMTNIYCLTQNDWSINFIITGADGKIKCKGDYGSDWKIKLLGYMKFQG